MTNQLSVPPYSVRKQLREATLSVGRRLKIRIACNECGHGWSVSPSSDPQCPKCNSVDFDVKE